MKKTLFVSILAVFWLWLGAIGHAQSQNCQIVHFPSGSVCVWIQSMGWNQYTIHTSVSSTINPSALMCTVEYGQNYIYERSCNNTIYHTANHPVRVRLYLNGVWQTVTLDHHNRWQPDQWQQPHHNLNNFHITTNTTSLNLQQRANITIQARDWNNTVIPNYLWTVSFSVQYRPHSNATWQQAPSSSYTLQQHNHSFSTNTNGQITLTNLIRFHTSGQYRLIVSDNAINISNHIQFFIWTSQYQQYGPIQNFGLSTNRSNPTTNQWSNITIQARDSLNRIVENYNQTVNFSIQHRPNNTSNRQNTPQHWYTLDRTYYTFGVQNNGQVTLTNLVRFHNNGQYRLVIQDNRNNIIWYIHFNVGSAHHDHTWFTMHQIHQISSFYNIWPTLIRQMESRYPTLKNHHTRQSQQLAIYQELFNISRWLHSQYSNYDAFLNALRNWYIYTLQIR